jgi:calcineurin-like phosphoesterase family protein
MSETFFAADHHFQHTNILKFRDKTNGKLLRPEFKSIEEHDEHIVGRHNSVVGVNDTVYMLGDVSFKTNARTRDLLCALNGKLILVPGNHDHIKFLLPFFHDIYMWKYMPEESMILSHVPLSDKDVQRAGFNVHGHIHQETQLITVEDKVYADPRYMCVSMEHIEYTPVPLDVVKRTRVASFKGFLGNVKKEAVTDAIRPD